MSESFARLIDGMIDTLHTHVLPKSDEFVRGQLFSVIFALNGLKLSADWKAGPLLEQVRLQDAAFAEVGRLAQAMIHPPLPALPRASGIEDVVRIEALRNEGDRLSGQLLFWATGAEALAADRTAAREIERVLRRSICDQLKIEIATTPKSMLEQIAGGEATQAQS